MNRGFLDLGGRNNNHRKKKNTDVGTGSIMESDGILNDVTPLAKEVVSSSVVNKSMAKEKQSPLVDITSLGSYPILSSYANVTSKPSGTKVNFCTLFTSRGNGIDVVVSVESIRAIRTLGVNMGWFDQCLARLPGYYPFNLALWMVWMHCLKMVKLHGVLAMEFNEDGLSTIATKLGADETKNLKNPSQTPKGFSVGQKMGFKPKQVYQPVSKKPIANTSRNKNNNVEPTCNPYPFFDLNILI
ncbi:hypothetical protein Tco_0668172 [Tanacetum coccineum]